MTDTELLDFCDEAFKRNVTRRENITTDVAIGDISVVVSPNISTMSFREVIERAVQQRINSITKRLAK